VSIQETPLYQAVLNRKFDTARHLIDHGADLHSTDSDGGTPLHATSQHGHLEVIKLLLRCGADVDMINSIRQNSWLVCKLGDRVRGKRTYTGYMTERKASKSLRSMSPNDMTVFRDS
jgi:hypothetical protein